MLWWISIFGGVRIMMGQHVRSEALFYYFRLEDQIPENHLLRLIDKHVSFEFVRQQLKNIYQQLGSAGSWVTFLASAGCAVAECCCPALRYQQYPIDIGY
jgi:hypothetical protein